MRKGFGLILMLIALYIGMKIYADEMDDAFGGIFAPLESARGDAPDLMGLSPAASEADAPSERGRRVPITEAVRDKVTRDIERGFERSRGR